MSAAKDKIEFLSGRRARFRFRCDACGRCCGEYRIILSPYDILRLRKATGCSTEELVGKGTIRIARESFKKVFGFAPLAELFDLFEVSRADMIPVAEMGFREGVERSRECEFLSDPNDGKRLCTIYKHRPTMCRLHPIGCTTIGGRRRWFFRHPLCETEDVSEQTVEGWIRASRLRPFLRANARYLCWMRELLEQCDSLSSVADGQWSELERILYNFDSNIQYGEKTDMKAIEAGFHGWLLKLKA